MTPNWLCGLLPACAAGIALLAGGSRTLAQPPREKKAPPGFENLSHQVTVRHGTTPITDEKGRKLVRVVDPDGRGYHRATVEINSASRNEATFRTDEQGLADVKAPKWTSMIIYAGSIHVWLRTPEAMRFPIEVVVTPDAPSALGAKKEAPEGFQQLKSLVAAKSGGTVIGDTEARKLVRVVDQNGRGVKGAVIEMQLVSSRNKWRFPADEDGLAEITKMKYADLMIIDAGPAQLRLWRGAIKFPLEVVVTKPEK